MLQDPVCVITSICLNYKKLSTTFIRIPKKALMRIDESFNSYFKPTHNLEYNVLSTQKTIAHHTGLAAIELILALRAPQKNRTKRERIQVEPKARGRAQESFDSSNVSERIRRPQFLQKEGRLR